MVILVGSPVADILAHSLTSFAMLLLSRNGALIISSADSETAVYHNV
jgi:hypothetical protein